MTKRLTLRIDVDFLSGWIDAVPMMLEQLERHQMQASFFGVIGQNRLGGSLRRLADRQYRERFLALGPRRVWSVLRHDRSQPGATMIERPEVIAQMRRIEAEGHELVLHGWDHRYWADQVWEAPTEALQKQVERAYDAVEAALGRRPRAWGSPNWRTRRELMPLFKSRDVPYISESWGESPFRCDGMLNLPVTDCLEPQLLHERTGRQPERVAAWCDERLSESYRMLCCHDYFEGLLHPELFTMILDACADRGWRVESLAQTAARLDCTTLPEGRYTCAPIAGFVGEVSWQSDAVLSSSAS